MRPSDAPSILQATYPATPGGLAQLLAEFDHLSPSTRWGEQLAYSLRLTLEELIVNAVNHGGQTAPDRWVAVSIAECAESLIVVVEDPGRRFDPTERPSPDTDANLNDREPGGLGIMLIKKLANSLHYQRIDGVNRTTAVLSRKSSDA